MPDRLPTIADVARRAGVSKGLVSFVFNDRPGVAPETRARIRAVAQEMGWRPRPNARSLSTRRSAALGLVVRRDPAVLSTDPFFPAFVAGVETVLADAGQVLVLSVVPDADAEQQAYRRLVAEARVDGVLLTDLRLEDPRLPLLAELGLPAVRVGYPDPRHGFPAVNLDDAAGVTASVQHLVGLGHRRLGYVAGDLAMVHARRRRDVFGTEVHHAGLPEPRVLDTDFSAARAAAATAAMLAAEPAPTAIMYASDLMAIAGMGVLQQRHLRVPGDVSVCGFDGSEVGQHLFPKLTTVVADPVAWGAAAARCLLLLIATGQAEDQQLAAARLVLGESTGPPSGAVGQPPLPQAPFPQAPSPQLPPLSPLPSAHPTGVFPPAHPNY